MALYEFTTYNEVPQGPQGLGPGRAAVIPITLEPGQRLAIDVVRSSGFWVQDFTIRCWISKQPLGLPDATLAAFVQTWQPNMEANKVFCLYDPTEQHANSIFAIPAAPGAYFLNILNLTNQLNGFSLTLTDTTDTGGA